MAGGRVGYLAHGVNVLVEAIASQDGLIHRRSGYAQASTTVRLREPDRALRSTAPINAVSWDWDVLTVALIHRRAARQRPGPQLLKALGY